MCSVKSVLLPLTVKLVGIASIDFSELLLKVGGEVDGGVEILPDEGVVLNIPLTRIVIPIVFIISKYLMKFC